MAGDRLTSIRLPGVWNSGLAEYGRKTVPEMVEALREYARKNKEVAEKILAASDEEFLVDTYLGVHAQRQRQILQPGRDPKQN